MASKDFGMIAPDYDFFVSHSSEAEQDLLAFSPELTHLGPPDRPLRVLDFGCGTGGFTEQVLKLLSWPPELLEVSLVEPVPDQLQHAASRLALLTTQPIGTFSTLPDKFDRPFDLIVAHHVLYYMEDLSQTLRQLKRALAPTGLMLLTMASWQNFLMRLWQIGYAALKRPVPHHAAEEVAAALEQAGIEYRETRVPYEICFPDSAENRRKILRFLFDHLLPEIGGQNLLDEFARYLNSGQIEISTECQHLVVKGR